MYVYDLHGDWGGPLLHYHISSTPDITLVASFEKKTQSINFLYKSYIVIIAIFIISVLCTIDQSSAEEFNHFSPSFSRYDDKILSANENEINLQIL